MAQSDNALGHLHTFTIACAHEGETSWSYTAEGAAHTHTIVLNEGQLAQIFSGETVTVITSDDLHMHTWVIQKPSSACESGGGVDAGTGSGIDAGY